MNISSITGYTSPVRGSKGVKPDKKRPMPKCAVGIEIEVEGMDDTVHDFTMWNTVHDGSLRNGIELVSTPVWGTDITKALNEVSVYFKKRRPYLSFRTSVHVHINVLDLDDYQLIKFISMYLLYEPALFKMHKEWNRYDNIFCIPVRKSYAIQEGYSVLFRDLKKARIRGNYVGYKYGALNPNSIATFGTLEFRHMGGTDNTDKISEWVNVLLCLKAASVSKTDVSDYATIFGDMNPLLEIEPSDLKEGFRIIEHINILNGGIS